MLLGLVSNVGAVPPSHFTASGHVIVPLPLALINESTFVVPVLANDTVVLAV